MTLTTVQYSPRAMQRGERALICSSFRLDLFLAMINRSIPLLAIASSAGFKSGYAKTILSESKVERELMWLIAVGLLRREVDGQGITDSFRLTPLGKQLAEKWQKQQGYFPRASWFDRLDNFLARWFRY